jgi:hypothetical protein
VNNLLRKIAPTRAQIFTASLIVSGMGLSIAAVSIPNTFTAGTAATAAQVNANFAALKTAVDALQTQGAADAARIATLETKLAALGANKPLASKFGAHAYAWANDATSASYTPNSLYSFNSAGGAITAARTGDGQYTMTFAGQGTGTQGAGNVSGGNVQVTAYDAGQQCQAVLWSGAADLVISVQCRVGTVLTDGRYSIQFTS